MRLSTRSTYGIRALVELAFASDRGPLSATVVAQRQELSVAYLEQLLHRLKCQGLVSSVRGPRGGYRLAKKPHQITMADVVRVLDGTNGDWESKPRDGARRSTSNGRTRPGAKGNQRHAQQIAHTVWRCVHGRLMDSLGAVTLEDVCDEVRAEVGEAIDHRYVFHI